MISITVCLLTNFLIGVESRGPRHPTVSHHHYHPKPSWDKKILDNDEILHDRRHIAEDLGEWAEKHEPPMVDEEMEFRYFKVHDLDNNTKLDGIEIYHAIKHSMDTAGDDYNGDNWLEKESTIVRLIDQVLLEDDTNYDGYLSYPEYVVGRQKEKRKSKN